MVNRSPMPPRSAPMRRTALKRARTPKLVASERTLTEAKAIVWARDHGLCWVCGARGFDHHHRLPRGQGGSANNPAIHSPANLIVLCRDHHGQYETRTRADGYDLGLLIRRGITQPWDAPIYDRFGIAWLLDDDGGMRPAPKEEAS